MPNWLTALLAIIGSATGISGLVISILNFRRDRATLVFELTFNRGSKDRPVVALKVTNLGRRPAFLSDVFVFRARIWRFGTTRKKPFFPFAASIDGQTLEEASEPAFFQAFQDQKMIARMLILGGYVRVLAKVNGRIVSSPAIKLPRHEPGAIGNGPAGSSEPVPSASEQAAI